MDLILAPYGDDRPILVYKDLVLSGRRQEAGSVAQCCGRRDTYKVEGKEDRGLKWPAESW
jgi:hypothetical protein